MRLEKRKRRVWLINRLISYAMQSNVRDGRMAQHYSACHLKYDSNSMELVVTELY